MFTALIGKITYLVKYITATSLSNAFEMKHSICALLAVESVVSLYFGHAKAANERCLCMGRFA